ncbi:MAG: hypothetical protein JO111_06020 [Caulobacteraceae bacterium]|nr:hypothetical protein [Caulobacteraceae bacterium]
MTDEEREAVVAAFGAYPLSPTATILLDALIRTWEEAIGDEVGLPEELRSLAKDNLLYTFLTNEQRGYQIRAVSLVHALQSLRLISNLAQRFPILNRIHLDKE